jgi:hypothetical protein
MDSLNTPHSPRPHRVIINVDAETLDALRALAYSARMSVSAVGADCLRMLLPTLRPVMEAMAQMRTAPAQALEKLSAHAEDVARMAQEVVDGIKAEVAAEHSPPLGNTGGKLPKARGNPHA